MMQFVVGSREMVQLPQHSQVPDVVDVIATDVQDTKRILNKDSNMRFSGRKTDGSIPSSESAHHGLRCN